ncbi:MAG TPA: enoyl-CoA hydratase/isomerase family protein [Gemmatimonadales bacterium]|nr:enoyl-CoA hydratase/isomerase family protein [Gemmatimonadales bacterium]
MPSEPLLQQLDSGVYTLTLNRPDKRNALSRAMIDALHEAVEHADLSADVRVVALRGAGRDFCAGLDLKELLATADQSPDRNEEDAMHLGSLFIKLRTLPKPVVAVTHGRTLAGGCGLATACDLVLASESGTFGYPEIQRGFVPAMVMTMLRRAVGEKQAFDLAATGRLVSAAEACAMGLVSRVLPDEGYAEKTGAMLRTMAASSASALAFTKRQLYELDGLSFADGVALGARINALARNTPDFRRAIEGFLES